MFEKLCSVVDESEGELDQLLNDEICQHLKTLLEKVQRYFLDSMETRHLL